ncbi:MAG: AraC family transcriptional regulator, partial [Myxococcota bacterium]
ERIAPTGSAVGVFVLGDPILQIPDDGAGPELLSERGFLLGPHDRPTVNAPTGETHALGIVTTMVGCAAVFGVPPASLRGRAVDLEASWEASRAIRERLGGLHDPEAMLDRVSEGVQQQLGPADPGLRRCARAVALLEADPLRSIADVARVLGISHGHLDREFTRVVGQSPRSLARLLRLRRLLAVIDVRRAVPWPELALRFGWFDQAHLIRDFKRHTGVTPTAYVRAQRVAFGPSGPGEGAGFAPDVDTP